MMSVALLLAVACTEKSPQVSDTERLIGEALEAVGSHDLPTAEQRAYSAAILSADSAEMADALTMLSLVFILENKKEKAEMVMAVPCNRWPMSRAEATSVSFSAVLSGFWRLSSVVACGGVCGVRQHSNGR